MHTCTCTQFTVSDQDVEALATVGLATSKAADVISSSKLLPVRVHKSKERRWERGKTGKGRPLIWHITVHVHVHVLPFICVHVHCTCTTIHVCTLYISISCPQYLQKETSKQLSKRVSVCVCVCVCVCVVCVCGMCVCGVCVCMCVYVNGFFCDSQYHLKSEQ